jgi:hypothetical protein
VVRRVSTRGQRGTILMRSALGPVQAGRSVRRSEHLRPGCRYEVCKVTPFYTGFPFNTLRWCKRLCAVLHSFAFVLAWGRVG